MTVHLFGAVSSPVCANYALKHLAKENSTTFQLGSQFIARDFYVDDGITSVKTEEDGMQLAQEARELCARGGLRMHKFVSNSSAVLAAKRRQSMHLTSRLKILRSVRHKPKEH